MKRRHITRFPRTALKAPKGLMSSGHRPSSVYDIQAFGAVGDRTTMNTEAIQRAVDFVSGKGGGTIYFPSGDYLMGTLRLRDNVTLYLENGCTIWGSTDLDDYDPSHKHLLYAENVRNIALVGRGAIDGQGPRFWDNGRLARWLRGEIDLPRTADMIRFDHCENITMEDIEVRYGAFWNIGFGDCRRITIRALTIDAPRHVAEKKIEFVPPIK